MLMEISRSVVAPRAVHLDRGAGLGAAIDLFRDHPSLRLLPVVDEHGVPVGAIAEVDVRGILFNPYGHALMQNPAFGRSLDR